MKSFKLFGTTFELESIREEKFNDIKKNIIEHTITKKFVSENSVYILYILNNINDRVFSMSFDGFRFVFNKKTNKVEKYTLIFNKSNNNKFNFFCKNIIGSIHMNIERSNIFNKPTVNYITILDIGLDFNKFEEKIKTTSLFM